MPEEIRLAARVESAAADVQTAKDGLAAAQQELLDAQAALAAAIATVSSVPNSTATPTTSTTTTLVPQATIDRVQQAEDDLARVSKGIDEDTPLALIEALRPDVLAKGADYAREAIVGADLVESRGGRVVRIPLVPDQSSTRLVERVRGSS